MKKIDKNPEQASELMLNCFQAMNHFKLIERNRRVATKKFTGESHTVSEWEDLLKISEFLN